MKLETWVHLSEIAAGLAVIVTLGFLIEEVRDNTLAIQRQSILEQTRAYASPFFEDGHLGGILAKIKEVDGVNPIYRELMRRYGLTLEESIAWERHLEFLWRTLEGNYLNEESRERLEAALKTLLAYPDDQLYWQQARASYSPEFVAFVEAVRATRPAESG